MALRRLCHHRLKPMRGSFIILALLFTLTGCSSTQLAGQLIKDMSASQGVPYHPNDPMPPLDDSVRNTKIGRPYQIFGVTYTPKVDWTYNKVGIASWYGDDFHELKTANGEIFDMDAMTAAHPTLPLPVLVRVTNLENGRQVVVRVNDRGPFKRGRIIDLSRRAAYELGMLQKGTARVRVQVIPREDFVLAHGGTAPPTRLAAAKTKPDATPLAAISPSAGNSTPEPNTVFIQAGAFSTVTNAQLAQQRLAPLRDIAPATIKPLQTGIYRVRLGPFTDFSVAENALTRVIGLGFSDATIIKP